MDKYEYKLKLDQMKSFTAENNYKAAAEIADTINWHKIKNVNALIKEKSTRMWEDMRRAGTFCSWRMTDLRSDE